MKVQIRKGVFETNSSSVHSIVIYKNASNLQIPSSLQFSLGEFGWEINVLTTPYEKAEYLYTALYCTNPESKYIDFIRNTLAEKNCTAEFESLENVSKWSYIDHSEELWKFIDSVMSSKDALLSYLFSDKSVVYTYNDNLDHEDLWFSDTLKDLNNDENFEVIRKGN